MGGSEGTGCYVPCTGTGEVTSCVNDETLGFFSVSGTCKAAATGGKSYLVDAVYKDCGGNSFCNTATGKCTGYTDCTNKLGYACDIDNDQIAVCGYLDYLYKKPVCQSACTSEDEYSVCEDGVVKHYQCTNLDGSMVLVPTETVCKTDCADGENPTGCDDDGELEEGKYKECDVDEWCYDDYAYGCAVDRNNHHFCAKGEWNCTPDTTITQCVNLYHYTANQNQVNRYSATYQCIEVIDNYNGDTFKLKLPYSITPCKVDETCDSATGLCVNNDWE